MNWALTPPFGKVATSNCFNKATVFKTINISDQERMNLKPVSIKLNTIKKKGKGKKESKKETEERPKCSQKKCG